MKSQTKAKHRAAGVVRPDELYTLTEVSARLGVGSWWLRSARKAGLHVLYSGGRGFVTGAALIAHLQATGQPEPEPDSE